MGRPGGRRAKGEWLDSRANAGQGRLAVPAEGRLCRREAHGEWPRSARRREAAAESAAGRGRRTAQAGVASAIAWPNAVCNFFTPGPNITLSSSNAVVRVLAY